MVTGAAGGMGAAEAALFAREGATVVVTDVQDELGRDVAERITKESADCGGSASYLPLDVSREDQWQGVIERTLRTSGRLDVLVNNAGIGGGGDEVTNFTVEQWDRVLGVNATGVFLGTKHGALAMRRTGGGSIINISSVYGLVGASRGAAYPASKGAVRAFTKAAAVQLATDNIRVNSVHPGFIDTPQTRWMMEDPEIVRELEGRTPLGRIATPEDIAPGVLYLASDESAYMTGAEFVIDGGITAQ
jgi:NAD(P)-dependent dehydrogenase (short-subunit alcohol dehydrogenase family)